MDDDLIRAALGTGVEPDPAPELLQRAVTAGVARRRRRLAVTAIAASFVVVVTGVAVATRGDGEEIVGVSSAPSTAIEPTPEPTATTSAPTTVPETTAPSPATDAPATIPITAPIGTSAPFVALPPSVEPFPCDDVPELTVDRVVVTVLSPAPARPDGFFQMRISESGERVVELWGPAGVALTVGDAVPDNPAQGYCPTSLVPLAFDGTFTWLTVDGWVPCGACGPPRPALVFRVDATTGEVVVAWSSGDPARVFDVDPRGDGSAVVLWGPFDGPGPLIAFDTSGEGSVLASWPVTGSVVDAHLAPGMSGDGRPDITYTTGASVAQPPRLHVVADPATGTEYVVDLSGTMIDPAFIGWSTGNGAYGDVLLVERWEGIGASVLVRVDGASPQRSSITVLGQGACWTDTGVIARGTWTFDSESIYEAPGTVELVDPSDLSVVRDLELDTFGGELACLSGEHVVATVYDAVPGSVVAGSERTLLLGGDGPVEVIRDPELQVVGRNAGD